MPKKVESEKRPPGGKLIRYGVVYTEELATVFNLDTPKEIARFLAHKAREHLDDNGIDRNDFRFWLYSIEDLDTGEETIVNKSFFLPRHPWSRMEELVPVEPKQPK